MALDLDDVETTHEQILQFALIGAAAELERVHEHWTAATERWERERKMLAESLERVKGECDAARAEAETLRNEVDALKSAASGWLRVGDWAHANPDGQIVRNTNGEWAAEDADCLVYGHTAIEAARAAGWHDFPGASDHSAGAP